MNHMANPLLLMFIHAHGGAECKIWRDEEGFTFINLESSTLPLSVAFTQWNWQKMKEFVGYDRKVPGHTETEYVRGKFYTGMSGHDAYVKWLKDQTGWLGDIAMST
jgi:hypothetical protein